MCSALRRSSALRTRAGAGAAAGWIVRQRAASRGTSCAPGERLSAAPAEIAGASSDPPRAAMGALRVQRRTAAASESSSASSGPAARAGGRRGGGRCRCIRSCGIERIGAERRDRGSDGTSARRAAIGVRRGQVVSCGESRSASGARPRRSPNSRAMCRRGAPWSGDSPAGGQPASSASPKARRSASVAAGPDRARGPAPAPARRHVAPHRRDGGTSQHLHRAQRVELVSVAEKSRLPVISSHAHHAEREQSVRRSSGLPRACSGDMYGILPLSAPALVCARDAAACALAMPKSASLTTPS